MSRRSRDYSLEGLAKWANLSTAERLSECIWTIRQATHAMLSTLVFEAPPDSLAGVDLRAAVTVLRTVTTELATRLPSPVQERHSRDLELEAALQRVEQALWRIYALPHCEQERAYEEAERIAAPYALAFFYEIRLLDRDR